MKIPISQPIDNATLLPALQQALPQYKIYPRQSFLVVEKTGMVGANVVVRKNKIIVVASFPNMGLQIGFVLAVVFLGVLIPLVLYFIFVYSKQSAVEKEVGAVINQILGNVNLGVGGLAQMGQQPYGQPPAGQPYGGQPPQQMGPPMGMGQPMQGQPMYGQPPQGQPPQGWGQQ